MMQQESKQPLMQKNLSQKYIDESSLYTNYKDLNDCGSELRKRESEGD
jgi:hypothetical protein